MNKTACYEKIFATSQPQLARQRHVLVPFLSSAGFSLLEFITVLVILGILAAIAIPRYVNLSSDASSSSSKSIAAALAAASADNYAKRSAGNTAAPTQVISNCNQIGALLPDGSLPAGYSIASVALTAGSTGICTVSGPNASSATFTGVGSS